MHLVRFLSTKIFEIQAKIMEISSRWHLQFRKAIDSIHQIQTDPISLPAVMLSTILFCECMMFSDSLIKATTIILLLLDDKLSPSLTSTVPAWRTKILSIGTLLYIMSAICTTNIWRHNQTSLTTAPHNDVASTGQVAAPDFVQKIFSVEVMGLLRRTTEWFNGSTPKVIATILKKQKVALRPSHFIMLRCQQHIASMDARCSLILRVIPFKIRM
ncbi:hypothetical protein BLNAU_16713 [Blattamonas nauphoetae]|uniref:Uncharacterized protein n=1 Tax=Blattamonas nauphoetae TaxID=2049346 RepID=A0ABQ9X857_9EUKA|nr:hypothetical protein BLNAU_16713 [Blattamonas nauphoetae]